MRTIWSQFTSRMSLLLSLSLWLMGSWCKSFLLKGLRSWSSISAKIWKRKWTFGGCRSFKVFRTISQTHPLDTFPTIIRLSTISSWIAFNFFLTFFRTILDFSQPQWTSGASSSNWCFVWKKKNSETKCFFKRWKRCTSMTATIFRLLSKTWNLRSNFSKILLLKKTVCTTHPSPSTLFSKDTILNNYKIYSKTVRWDSHGILFPSTTSSYHASN